MNRARVRAGQRLLATTGLADPPSDDLAIQVSDVSQTFRPRHRQADLVEALQHASMHARRGEFVSILGPSGCGKSTLLNIIAGLIRPVSGDVLVGGRSVIGTTGHGSYMPQGDHLLPWRNVLDNAILGLEIDGIDRRKARHDAEKLLSDFGLGAFLKSFPGELSGGMKQRVAFIRTMLFRREILLLDEPLGALDAQTRLLLQEWLLELWSTDQKTVIFVTHDVDEATFLSDRVYVMSARPGRMIDEVPVGLPRPRTSDARVSPPFLAIRSRLLREVGREATRADQQGTA